MTEMLAAAGPDLGLSAAKQAGYTIAIVLVTIPALVAACFYGLLVLKDVLQRMTRS